MIFLDVNQDMRSRISAVMTYVVFRPLNAVKNHVRHVLRHMKDVRKKPSLSLEKGFRIGKT
jgi:hypothetical protein